jgi:imidazolonepropionase-like amidohydrolase
MLALDYLDSFVEAEIPPLSILKSLTIDAAQLVGVDGERGNIKPGLEADLIAVSEDPLADINALKSVTFVMKAGKIIKPASQDSQ